MHIKPNLVYEIERLRALLEPLGWSIRQVRVTEDVTTVLVCKETPKESSEKVGGT